MPQGIYSKIQCHTENHPLFTPQEHQKQVLDYFLKKSKYKGLLLLHRLGSGKSCSSILLSDEMIHQSKVKKVFVLTPGSLRQNFIEEYCEKCGKSPKYLKKYYTFITTNYAVGKKLPDFNDSFVIIDEVHNLINGVKNNSINPTIIYKALLKSNCRILALSGTPIVNYYWEWSILGNLLKPGEFPNIFNKDNTVDSTNFTKLFDVDNEGIITAKPNIGFDIQLRGIISYFPGISGGFYPEVIHEPPIKIEMTPLQYNYYDDVADREEKIRCKGPPKLSLLKSDSKKYWKDHGLYVMATKYIMTRKISNFHYINIENEKDEIEHLGTSKQYYLKTEETSCIEYFNSKKDLMKSYPDAKKTDIVEKITKNDTIGWVKKDIFKNNGLTDIYSRKFTALITNVINNWNAKHVMFSFFKTKAGVNLIHALFKMCGIKTEIYSGDISDTQRKTILKTFNAENNRYGDKIKILLITEAGAEGINILEAQHMHILESSTRELKIQQVIGRVVRYKSHMVDGRKPMPKNEQVVHIWRYWSVSNKTVNKPASCVDEILYENGRKIVNNIQSFLKILKKASITPYDKSYDKDGFLLDYTDLKISEKLENAFKKSDERYPFSYKKWILMNGGLVDQEVKGKKHKENKCINLDNIEDDENENLDIIE
jgi:superfamily II DNA or RNA helicase